MGGGGEEEGEEEEEEEEGGTWARLHVYQPKHLCHQTKPNQLTVDDFSVQQYIPSVMRSAGLYYFTLPARGAKPSWVLCLTAVRQFSQQCCEIANFQRAELRSCQSQQQKTSILQLSGQENTHAVNTDTGSISAVWQGLTEDLGQSFASLRSL